ncbi:hypothetical protein [Arthrobacter sp.]|uniref:hypothetical protein n=1 Tax=Arthrobacter sp. TaxID=1667 RepID=UPI0028113048|nr:hypothetical protein [Arthrobacter sp.]
MKRSQLHTWLITAASAGAVVAVGVAMVGALRSPAPQILGPVVGVSVTQSPAPPGTLSPTPSPTASSSPTPSPSPSRVPSSPAPEPTPEPTPDATISATAPPAAEPPPAVVPAPPPVILEDDRGRGRGGVDEAGDDVEFEDEDEGDFDDD